MIIIVYRVATFNNCDAAYKELVKVKFKRKKKTIANQFFTYFYYLGNRRS